LSRMMKVNTASGNFETQGRSADMGSFSSAKYLLGW
jgi:hypothetical protein